MSTSPVPDTSAVRMIRATIERLGHLGDGVAEGPVYVPRALPGEVVEGTVTGDRMDTPRIFAPSAERVSAPCPHYRSCGGCALQHARESFVTGWKHEVIVRALAAQGLEAPFRPAHLSPPGARRRAGFAGRRLKRGALVGFHGRASHVITPVPDCLVLHPDLTAALPLLEEVTTLAASRKGVLGLALTRSGAGLDLALSGAKPLDRALRATLGQWAGRAGLARLACDGDVIAQAAPPWQQFGRARVTPPPGAFLQATPQAEAAMQDAVREIMAGAGRVVDLFAGCGTFSLPLAETAEVHAVEGAGDMLRALDQGWRQATGLRRVTTATRDLFREPLAPDELAEFDAAIIDPPRAGAAAQAAALAESAIPRIAALSCNPVSFARDAKTLVVGGYRLEWVQLIDQFRFSPHVELAAEFSR